LAVVLKPKKAKTVLESLKMVNNEKENKMKYQFKEVKISTALYSIAHCQK